MKRTTAKAVLSLRNGKTIDALISFKAPSFVIVATEKKSPLTTAAIIPVVVINETPFIIRSSEIIDTVNKK